MDSQYRIIQWKCNRDIFVQYFIAYLQTVGSFSHMVGICKILQIQDLVRTVKRMQHQGGRQLSNYKFVYFESFYIYLPESYYSGSSMVHLLSYK